MGIFLHPKLRRSPAPGPVAGACLLLAAGVLGGAAAQAAAPAAGAAGRGTPAQVFELPGSCPGHPKSPDDEIGICTRAIKSGALSPEDLASAYYYRGTAWVDKRRYDEAIADYGEAVKADPELGVAFYNRAIARNAIGDADGAIADYGETLRIDPQFAAAYSNRASVQAGLGHPELAVPDYNEAIRIDPAGAKAYFGRGISQFNLGRFDNARDDFAEAARLGMATPYVAIWQRLAETRAGASAVVAGAHLQLATEGLDVSLWPGPVVEHYRGRMAAEALLQFAEGTDAKVRPGRICEARFFVAEFALLANDAGKAEPLLASAEQDCPHDYTQYQATLAERRRLQR